MASRSSREAPGGFSITTWAPASKARSTTGRRMWGHMMA